MGWRSSIAGEKDLTIYVERTPLVHVPIVILKDMDVIFCRVLFCRKSRKIKQHPRRTDVVVLAAILDFLQEIRDTVKN